MSCAGCAERRAALARAQEAYRRGDLEAVKRELQFVARTSLEDAKAAMSRQIQPKSPETK